MQTERVVAKGYLSEGIHAAFRKASSHPNAGEIWQLIHALPQAEWKAIVDFIYDGCAGGPGHDLVARSRPVTGPEPELQAHTPEPWFVGPTPAYLAMGQVHDGRVPLTLRSPAHTEEIATFWTYLLPTEANAARAAACVNACAGIADPAAWIASAIPQL